MIYPEYLKKGDVIAVTAPSDGNSEEIDIIRLERAKKALIERGLKVIETPDVRNSEHGRSAPALQRAAEFVEAWESDGVKAVISAKGGDFLMEMLSYLPFDRLAKKPVWFQGYSDNTSIGFILSTKYDIASIYCNNFNDFAMEEWHDSINNNWNILCGNNIVQTDYDYFQNDFFKGETGKEGYQLSEPVKWECHSIIDPKSTLDIQGRLAGGCLDVLLNIVGTHFDNVKAFTDKYADDGILWFFETFSLTGEDIERGLWQLKESGWFENARGFIFGRPAFFNSFTDTTFNEAVRNALSDFNLPIITGADIGHRPPQFTLINGGLCDFQYNNGKVRLIYI